jgi:hypothetical protein
LRHGFATDEAPTRNYVDVILRIFLVGLPGILGVPAQSPNTDNQDQATLIALESVYLFMVPRRAVKQKATEVWTPAAAFCFA